MDAAVITLLIFKLRADAAAARIALNCVTIPLFSMFFFNSDVRDPRHSLNNSTKVPKHSLFPPRIGNIVTAILTQFRKIMVTWKSLSRKDSCARRIQCVIISILTKFPMAVRRARVFVHEAVALPSRLVRLGNSSKTRALACGEWLGSDIDARTV